MRPMIYLLFSIVLFSPTANADLKADWQHYQLSFYELLAAQRNLKTSFPNLYVFNPNGELTAMALQANTGLFKNIDLNMLATRPLPSSESIKARLKLIKPLINNKGKKGLFTVVMVIPDKSVVDCVACNAELSRLDELLHAQANPQVQLALVTVIRQ